LSLAVADVRIGDDRPFDIAHADIVRRGRVVVVGDHGVVRGKLAIERDVAGVQVRFVTIGVKVINRVHYVKGHDLVVEAGEEIDAGTRQARYRIYAALIAP
jgi:hypothetical protein